MFITRFVNFSKQFYNFFFNFHHHIQFSIFILTLPYYIGENIVLPPQSLPIGLTKIMQNTGRDRTYISLKTLNFHLQVTNNNHMGHLASDNVTKNKQTYFLFYFHRIDHMMHENGAIERFVS